MQIGVEYKMAITHIKVAPLIRKKKNGCGLVYRLFEEFLIKNETISLFFSGRSQHSRPLR
jgi:hypothetical protein